MLVVAGGHGDVGELFEKGEDNGFGPLGYTVAQWLAFFVQPLAAAGVGAHNIVLDACLSASMIPAFEPLIAPGGQVFATMYSLESGNLVDEATWRNLLQVVDAGGGAVRQVLQERTVQHHHGRVLEHRDQAEVYAAAGMDVPPVPADLFGVYDFASRQLRYDAAIDTFPEGFEPRRDVGQLRGALEASAPDVVLTPTARALPP